MDNGLERIHKGELADLSVQTLTCHQSKDCQGEPASFLARPDEVVE